MGSVLEVDDMDIRHNISNLVGILIHTKSMGEINKCIPIKVNGRVYQVRISEDHNRSILLNNLDDSKKGSLEEDSLFSDEDDDSNGILEMEVVQNSEEAPFNDDHQEVVKNHEFDSSEFDSSSHVSPTYEEAAREASECSLNCNVHLNSNLNQDMENDIHTDVNLEAQQHGKAHSVINHEKGKAHSPQPSLAHLKNHTSNFLDPLLRSESCFSGPTNEIKDEIRRALGLVCDEVYEEVAKEQE
ncbi:hypothetical protein Tco_0912636, partial [Tanacetum coccineum]